MKETDFVTRLSQSEHDVIEFYDEYAPSWDDRFGDKYATELFLARRWTSFLKACEISKTAEGTAIELGVGTGCYISKAAEKFSRLVAVDGSAKMLELLRQKLSRQHVENVEIIQSNVLSIESIEDASADCVFFFGLIEHIVDTSSFLSELNRLLKPGGVAIGVTPNGKSPWYRLRQMVRGTGKHCTSDKYYSLTELKTLWEQAGFEPVAHEYWGAVPAGISNGLAKLLSKLEPILEKSPLRSLLGGLTFSYRKPGGI